MDQLRTVFELVPAYFLSVMTVLGLVIGSFLNVVAIRIPRGESVSTPPSHCMSCGTRLTFLDLIPVLSYFLLRGKCRTCCAPFSIQYALWELASGILFLCTAWVMGPTGELLLGLLLVSLLIPIVQTDLKLLLIPDKIVYFGMVASASLRIWIHPLPLWNYASAFVLGGGLMYGMAWAGEKLLKKESLGGGDIKLLAMLGLFLGLKLTLVTLFLSSLAGTVIIGAMMILRKLKRDQYVPFGPFIAIGAWTAFLCGDRLLHWYVSLLV